MFLNESLLLRDWNTHRWNDMSGIYFKIIQWPRGRGRSGGGAWRWYKTHHMLIIKAGHGHMGICFNIFFTFVIEKFHSKKVFLSKMVLFLGFLNNVTKIQIHKSYVFDGIRTVHQIWEEEINLLKQSWFSKNCGHSILNSIWEYFVPLPYLSRQPAFNLLSRNY